MVTKIKSKIEDSSHIYSIASGNSREGLAVYLVSSHANRVSLALASDISTSDAIGIIKKDYGNNVELDFNGDVDAIPETGISFSYGNKVFLSSIEAGRVTNVSPTTGVCLKLGKASTMKSNGMVQMNLVISEMIEL